MSDSGIAAGRRRYQERHGKTDDQPRELQHGPQQWRQRWHDNHPDAADNADQDGDE